MKCIFIYNPVSGRGRIAYKLDIIVNELKECYDVVDVCATKAAGDMTRLAREAIGVYDTIVFSGGDGSFNEVLQAVAEAENPPQIGYIPLGTVNDIAHTLKIPRNIKKALRVIKEGRTELLDCMKANDRYVMYVIAAGAFTSATYTTPQEQKNQAGKIAYYVEGVTHNLDFEAFKLKYQGEGCKERTDTILISFMNSRYVAGFNMNNRSSLQDGKIEVAIVKQKRKPNILQRIGGLFNLAKLFLFGYNNAKSKNLVHLEGSHFDVSVGNDVVWNFDGEKGSQGKLHIEVVPKRVKMILPKKLKKI